MPVPPGRRARRTAILDNRECILTNEDGEMDDATAMDQALDQAREAARLGDVPVGAVVVRNGEVIGRGHNRREADGDPLAHAEILALREAAGATEGWRLVGATIFVTLEPCAMCAGALVNSRVGRLVYATADPKAGWCGSLGDLARDPRLNHRLVVEAGLRERESRELLRGFFESLRRRRRAVREGHTSSRDEGSD
jgi:tRNA(adenine34) deaminase